MSAQLGIRDEVARLRRDNEALRAQIEAIRRDVFGDDLVLPVSLQLSPMERRMFTFMLRRPQVTRDALSTACTRYAGEEISPDSLRVLICRLRRKIIPLGLEIETIAGLGYRIAEPGRTAFLATLPVAA